MSPVYNGTGMCPEVECDVWYFRESCDGSTVCESCLLCIQVEEWYPELMEIEEQAKQAASVLLFVVDDKTRAVASMVEVAHLAGLGRELVLVVEDIRGENPQVGGAGRDGGEREGRGVEKTVEEEEGGGG